MIETEFEPGLASAQEMDRQDNLASFRDAFVIDHPDLIYLDGNSLGRLPRKAAQRLHTAVEDEWGRDLIRSWNANWFSAPTRVGEKIARLVGAGPEQVVVSDSTSVNLFKLVMAALALRPDRLGIVSDVLNFPSDLYILQGCSQLLGNRHQTPTGSLGRRDRTRPPGTLASHRRPDGTGDPVPRLLQERLPL